jgi:hypothetical protein
LTLISGSVVSPLPDAFCAKATCGASAMHAIASGFELARIVLQDSSQGCHRRTLAGNQRRLACWLQRTGDAAAPRVFNRPG